MNILWKATGLCFLLLLSSVAQAKQINIKHLRYKQVPNHHSRLIFDISSTLSHELILLKNPARIVVDVKNATLTKALAQPSSDHPLVKKIRTAARNKTDLRIVIDLKEEVAPKVFTLKPSKSKGHRLVVDLPPTDKK